MMTTFASWYSATLLKTSDSQNSISHGLVQSQEKYDWIVSLLQRINLIPSLNNDVDFSFNQITSLDNIHFGHIPNEPNSSNVGDLS